MAQIVVIKLKSAGPGLGPFTITDNFNNVLEEGVSRERLKTGVSYAVVDEATVITICSTGKKEVCKDFSIDAFDVYKYADTKFDDTGVSCVWRHLRDPLIYNEFYGAIEPYIIEYPFAYQYEDQILHAVQDHTKVWKYVPTTHGVLEDHAKYEMDDAWFNKAILYNDQQCSGVLTLVPRPANNLQAAVAQPKFNADNKEIYYTKDDNIYYYNTFWNVTKDSKVRQFIETCESLSIDKVINQDNMDYGIKSHKKATLRAKELKVRHILDNRSDIHLVSQFVITPTQISH